MKWFVYTIGLVLLIQTVAGEVCDPSDNCNETPEPIKTGVDVVIFPFRPIFDIIHQFAKRIFGESTLLRPVKWLFGLATIPFRLIRWIVYLPMHLLLAPVRIGMSICNGLTTVLRVFTFVPRKILMIPIHTLISPIITIKAIAKLPIRIADLIVRFLQDPPKAVLGIISDIINMPYLHFIPPLAILWMIFIPVGWIFKYLFC